MSIYQVAEKGRIEPKSCPAKAGIHNILILQTLDSRLKHAGMGKRAFQQAVIRKALPFFLLSQ